MSIETLAGIWLVVMVAMPVLALGAAIWISVRSQLREEREVRERDRMLVRRARACEGRRKEVARWN
jgi:hypothetical protein